MTKLALLVAVLAGCPTNMPPPIMIAPIAGGAAPTVQPPNNAREATQDEKLAAIQKAMNELDEAVQGCWAAAAARDRFDIEGALRVMIEIGDRPGTSRATIVQDTVRNAGLATCVTSLLQGYPWAPPLAGQAIELPFELRAPSDGQNVIDRRLVPWNGQGKVSVAVLLDAANSGNDAASMFELAIQAGGATGMRVTEREEIWYFLGAATISEVGAAGKRNVAAGDMAYVPKGAAREVSATAGDTHAVIVMLPGGREGTGRAGALPTRELGAARSAPAGVKIVPASMAKTFGAATIYMEPSTTGATTFAAELLTLPPGSAAREHVHAKATELLYVLEGSGTITVAGTVLAFGPTSVVQVPPNTKHTLKITSALRAVQLFTPAGPEQQFKAAAK